MVVILFALSVVDATLAVTCDRCPAQLAVEADPAAPQLVVAVEPRQRVERLLERLRAVGLPGLPFQLLRNPQLEHFEKLGGQHG
jgi:hypothetical protein